MADLQMPRKLWEHPRPKETQIWRFMKEVERRRRIKLETFRQLHKWSVDSRLDFWDELFKIFPPVHDGGYQEVCDPSAPMDSLPKWFEGVNLNFAENVLYATDQKNPSQSSTAGKEDAKVAVTEVREGGTEIQDYTWKDLRTKVGLLSNVMRNHGMVAGDRVAIVASNSFDTLCVFLAITTIGGIFSSSSTDMGTKGVLDRLLQIKPKYVFVDDFAIYNGKSIDLRPKMKEIEAGCKPIAEFKGLVFLPRHPSNPADITTIPRSTTLSSYLNAAQGTSTLDFVRQPFITPFLIVYSSGTTGVPKCIMHSAGGVLLSSTKEGKLHKDLTPSTVNLQYTTTGWIMYLNSILSLHHGARAVLYDGSPFLPTPRSFLSLVADQHVTDLGVSPKYLQTIATAGIVPRKEFDLSALTRVTSTGMVLPESLFTWFYDVAFPPAVQLANIAGGTDLAACFALENPLEPVYLGGCVGPGLALKVEVYDQTIEGEDVQGRAVVVGEPGELVCTRGFPNQPPGFFGDESGEKYKNAYYGRFKGVWTHGDFIYFHPRTGGIYFLGRADGVLNPSGVRFGSAEIYNVVETFFRDEVADSLCVGQRRKGDEDERVMLFLKMNEGHEYSRPLVERVKGRIAEQCSKRHVPRFVFQTWEIPTTVNLKKVELPVKRIVSGERVKPSGTLLNGESLEFYYQFIDPEGLERKEGRVSKL